jgi:hypothetical protein
MVDALEVEKEEQVEKAETYDLHIRVPRAMKEKLTESAQLDYKLEVIPKPTLADLMNLYVTWGMTLLKSHYIKRIGAG